MVIKGVAEVELQSPKITSLQGVEKRCSQCKKLFEDHDAVVVFIQSGFVDGAVPLSDDSTYLLHLQGSCLEEFVGGVLATVKELPSAPVVPSPQGIPSETPAASADGKSS